MLIKLPLRMEGDEPGVSLFLAHRVSADWRTT